MLPQTILIIDDDNDISSLMLQYLQIEGYDNVERASNGLEGFEKYKALSPDFVFMDIEMPVMDGYESCCAIKDFDPEAKILVITGNPNDTRAQRILKQDMAFALLKKPCKLEDLGRIILETQHTKKKMKRRGTRSDEYRLDLYEQWSCFCKVG